jgi:hypothetical protein
MKKKFNASQNTIAMSYAHGIKKRYLQSNHSSNQLTGKTKYQVLFCLISTATTPKDTQQTTLTAAFLNPRHKHILTGGRIH